MYTYKSRIRYSEIDKNGKLSLTSLLNYFQDCSTFHSEDLGLGYKYLLDHDILWVLSAWQIIVHRYPLLCENIIIGTAPYEFRSVIGYRNFLMTTESGEELACANSVWTLLDMKRGRPTKPDSEIINGYQLEEKLPMDYADRKITVQSEGIALPLVEVKSHHLDTNNHVNNGQYINIAMDLLTDYKANANNKTNIINKENEITKTNEIRQLRAEYRNSAVLGDILYPRFITSNNAEIISLQDARGNKYCIAEFTRKY